MALIALASAIILLGVWLVVYPYVSDYQNRVAQSRISHTQVEVVARTSETDLSAEFERARDFNERLLAGRVVVTDPFDPNNQSPTDEEYESVLNLAGDGVMGQIYIPKIDLSLPIYHGVEGEHLEHGVGHMPSTTLPVGGPSTHAALAGHTGLATAHIFDSLTELGEGDWFVISVMGEELAYQVTGTEVVLPDETESLHVVEGEDLVTLVTCTPYGVNTHRLLVHGRRCPLPDEWLEMKKALETVPFVPATVRETPKFLFTVAGLVASFALLALWVVLMRRHRRRVEEAARADAAAVLAAESMAAAVAAVEPVAVPRAARHKGAHFAQGAQGGHFARGTHEAQAPQDTQGAQGTREAQGVRRSQGAHFAQDAQDAQGAHSTQAPRGHAAGPAHKGAHFRR